MNKGLNIDDLTEQAFGRWVRYTGNTEEVEDGRIKSWNDHYIFVVYQCDGQWDRYQEFTGVATEPDQLSWLKDVSATAVQS